jgi:hypothetical protein
VINAQTGIVTTSCSHSFHFACIASWHLKKEKGTCPCCRKEMGPTEDFPDVGDSDEDSDYEEEEDEEVEFTRDGLHAFLREQGGSGLTDAMAALICPEVAVFTSIELHALCVGNGGREITEEIWNELLEQEGPFDADPPDGPEDTTAQVTYPFDAANFVSHHHFMWQSEEGGAFHRILKNAEQVNKGTIKIQALWRGYSARQTV